MATVNEFAESWTYRSFINNPEFKTKAGELLLAEFDLILEVGVAGDTSAGSNLGGGSEISGKQFIHDEADFYLAVSGTPSLVIRPSFGSVPLASRTRRQ